MMTIQWADINDDELNLNEVEGLVSVEGDTKTSTQFVEQAGGLLKVITKSKVHRRVERISREADERRARMRSFMGPPEALMVRGEETPIDLPRSMRKIEDDDADTLDVVEREPLSSLSLLRKDGVSEKFNQLRRLEGTVETLDRMEDFVRDTEEPRGPQPYQPPRGRMMDQQRDDCTIRVTNLSEETKEDDLKELFGKIGRIHRIFLAKDKETRSSKGFAFITYEERANAAKAIQALDRHGYDNLLLKVEWAKPSLKLRE